MDVLLQHVPDLAGVAPVIQALVLRDHLRGQPEEGGGPLHLGGEVEDRWVGREVAVDADELAREPLKVEPVVLAPFSSQLADRVGRRLLAHAVEAQQPLLARVDGMSSPQLAPQHIEVAQGVLDILSAVGGQSLVQVACDADVVHDPPVVLGDLGAVRPLNRTGAVSASDGLEEAMLLQRLVEIHYFLDRRVEAGQQLVADDQEAGRLAEGLERLLGFLLRAVVEVVGLKLGDGRR